MSISERKQVEYFPPTLSLESRIEVNYRQVVNYPDEITEKHHVLKWDRFADHVRTTVAGLYSGAQFCDVNLACGDVLVKAHKIVLATNSPFFRQIFEDLPCKNECDIFIEGLKYQTLKAILQYLYLGQVVLNQVELEEFLDGLDFLRIDCPVERAPVYNYENVNIHKSASVIQPKFLEKISPRISPNFQVIQVKLHQYGNCDCNECESKVQKDFVAPLHSFAQRPGVIQYSSQSHSDSDSRKAHEKTIANYSFSPSLQSSSNHSQVDHPMVIGGESTIGNGYRCRSALNIPFPSLYSYPSSGGSPELGLVSTLPPSSHFVPRGYKDLPKKWTSIPHKLRRYSSTFVDEAMQRNEATARASPMGNEGKMYLPSILPKHNSGIEYSPSSPEHIIPLSLQVSENSTHSQSFEHSSSQYPMYSSPRPKTKEIRSAQIPKSFRYTSEQVDELVEAVANVIGAEVPCAICGKVVKRERLRAHIHECHLLTGQKIVCSLCGLSLKSKGSYRVHIWRHRRGTLPMNNPKSNEDSPK